MNDTIIYRPYENEKWFVPFFGMAAVLTIFASGYAFPRVGDTIFLSLIGCLYAWLSKCLYDSSNIVVRFESEGIRIVAGFNVGYHYILWENLSYAYYIFNARGHRFLILSSKDFGYKSAKQLVNKFTFPDKAYVDSCIVIPCDNSPIGKSISALIEQRVPCVHTFGLSLKDL